MDDEANIRRMLGALLRAEGFDGRGGAERQRGAARSSTRSIPTSILLDLLMPPGPDGLETLARTPRARAASRRSS